MKLYVKAVYTCQDCPGCDPAGAYAKCTLTDRKRLDAFIIPDWCPLKDFDDGVRCHSLPVSREEGELMSLEEFVQAVMHDAFTNSDGTGYFATQKWRSNIQAIPSELGKGKAAPRWATHVVWYNK